MIVLSDTTPVISLLKINQLELLKTLFGQVLIPEAVFRELTMNAAFSEESEKVQNSDFLKVVPIQNKKSLEILQKTTGLDDGESEAIILADEQKSDLLIIDERKGRKVAAQLGIMMTGTVGVLLQAHDEKLLSTVEVKSCLEQLKDSNIRIGENVVKAALERLDESD